MYRILIVEDVDTTLNGIYTLLTDEFPDSQIDRASTVNEGRELIIESQESDNVHNVVILDFKLPTQYGDNPEVDEELCKLIRQATNQTLVIHITAHPDDEKIQKHLEEVHLSKVSSNSIIISKLDAQYGDKLLGECKAYLYGQPIIERLNFLFEGSKASSGTYRGRNENSGVSATHELAMLASDITNHWHDLDTRLQNRIRSTFIVDTDQTPLRISLL